MKNNNCLGISELVFLNNKTGNDYEGLLYNILKKEYKFSVEKCDEFIARELLIFKKRKLIDSYVFGGDLNLNDIVDLVLRDKANNYDNLTFSEVITCSIIFENIYKKYNNAKNDVFDRSLYLRYVKIADYFNALHYALEIKAKSILGNVSSRTFKNIMDRELYNFDRYVAKAFGDFSNKYKVVSADTYLSDFDTISSYNQDGICFDRLIANN